MIEKCFQGFTLSKVRNLTPQDDNIERNFAVLELGFLVNEYHLLDDSIYADDTEGEHLWRKADLALDAGGLHQCWVPKR